MSYSSFASNPPCLSTSYRKSWQSLFRILPIFAAVLVFGSISGCSAQSQDEQIEKGEAMTGKEKLAKDLVEGTYGTFYNYYNHEETIDSIWGIEENHGLLYEIVEDVELNGKARFLAAEILFSRELTFLSRFKGEMVAGIYADALVNNYTGNANTWGLLYEPDDFGPVGIRFDMIGKAAIPTLVGLLDNSDHGTFYEGSKEATMGNSYNYRIKDFAAFYLGKIIGYELKYFESFEQRDEQIEALKKELNKN